MGEHGATLEGVGDELSARRDVGGTGATFTSAARCHINGRTANRRADARRMGDIQEDR